jgi:uncharacterized membrane protein
MLEVKRNPLSSSRHPALVALWLMLAAAYLFASITGLRAMAMAVVGLMVGALLAASGRPAAGVAIGVSLAGICLYFYDSMVFIAYAPPLAAFAFMAFFFYRTLRPGSEPLITRVARKEHADLSPAIVRYTRMLTWAWSISFAVLFGLSLLLARVLAFDAWSRWVQGLGYLLPGAFFLGEYVYRHYCFPERTHGSLLLLISNILTVSKEAALPTGNRDTEFGR